MAEAWTESADKSEAIVTGRELQPLWRRIPLVPLILMLVALPLWWPAGIVPGWIVLLLLGLTLLSVLLTGGFANDEEPMAGPEYLAGYPYWLRVVGWYTRNPLQNFGKYTMGVYDRDYTVYGTPPVKDITAWNDLPGWTFETGRRGWKWSVIRLKYMRLPFVSYVGKKWMWYLGWSWWGFFGAKLNKLNSSFQVV